MLKSIFSDSQFCSMLDIFLCSACIRVKCNMVRPLRSHKMCFVRSRRPLLLQFRELSNNMEETSNASVPGFVLAPAPNIEGAEESAKYHHEKTTAAKLEIEKTLKVSPHKRRPENVDFFANTFVLQIQRTCLKRSSKLARRLISTGGSTKTVTLAMFITLKNLIS